MPTAEPERRSGPLPLGLPLVLILLATLTVDRALGLTAFATRPGSEGMLRVAFPGSATLLADVAAVLAVVVALTAVAIVGRPRRRGALLALLVVVWLAALQLGAAASARATGTDPGVDLFLARALLLAGTTAAAIIVLRSLAQHRSAVRALQEATARSEALSASGRATLAGIREDVTAQVRGVLADALATLADGRPGPAVRLRGLAEDVLRPLSHRLARSETIEVPPPPPVVAARWRDTFVAVLRTPVVPARSLALIAAGLALLPTFVTDQDTVRGIAPADPTRSLDPSGGLGLSVDLVPFGLVLLELATVLVLTWWGARGLARLLDGRGHRLPAAVAWATVGAVLLAVSSLALLASFLIGLAPFGTGGGAGVPSVALPGPVALLATFLPLAVVTVGASLVDAVERARAGLEADLVRRSDAVARAAARLQAVVAHERQRLARALHADVQASVNAVGLVLDRAEREDRVTPDLLEDLADRIGAAVERFLGGAASTLPLLERLAEVRALWAGVSDIDLEVDPDVAAAVDGDPVARDLLVDLVAEACANAVVHGGATLVRVRIGPGASGATWPPADVDLTVADDGTSRKVSSGPAASSGAGLGSEVLRASCTRFTLELAATGATLRVSIPIG